MRRVALFVWVLMVGACSRSTQPDVEDYGIVSCGADNGGTIVLTFTAPNGTTPIAGADVSVSNCTGKTDGNGSIQMMDVPAGSHTLTIKKGIFQVSTDVAVESGQELNLGKVSLSPDAKRMLVIPGSFDRIQDVLTRLGFVYDSVDCGTFSSWSQDSVNAYDYLFFNCGAGCNYYDLGDKLVQFLNSGNKRVYASDWSYDIAEAIDSSAIDFFGDDASYGSAQVGNEGQVMAHVVDPDLQQALGRDSMLVNFDLGSWVVMTGVGPQTDVLIRGDAYITTHSGSDSTIYNAPFAVIYPYGQGKVLYTSFHNEAQNTQDMDVILEQMILK